jgi:hypothetical protein
VSTEAELLAARLGRIKKLIKVLDSVTGRNAEQEAAFQKLKQEMQAVRDSLRVLTD